MTKVIKWWARISTWNKIRSILTAIGLGSEFALFLGDSHEIYKWVVGGATLLAIIITHGVEDRDGDGQVDIFQKDKNAPK